MGFFRYYLGTAFVLFCVSALLMSCSSPLQEADKLSMSEPEAAIAAYKQIMETSSGSPEAMKAHLGIASTYYDRMEDYEKV